MPNFPFLYLRNVFFIVKVYHLWPVDTFFIIISVEIGTHSWSQHMCHCWEALGLIKWQDDWLRIMFLARKNLVKLNYCMIRCGICHKPPSLLSSFLYISFYVSQNTWLLQYNSEDEKGWTMLGIFWLHSRWLLHSPVSASEGDRIQFGLAIGFLIGLLQEVYVPWLRVASMWVW